RKKHGHGRGEVRPTMDAMNTWGNNGHGPGGDPSWLGGKDRGAGQPRSGDGTSGDAAWNGSGGSEQNSVYQSGSYQYGGYQSAGHQPPRTQPAPSQPTGPPSDFSSDFSSGFPSGGPRPTSDFDSSADEMSPEFGARAQRSAPREQESDGPEWKAEFMKQTGLGKKAGKRSPVQMVIGMISPIILLFIFFTVFSRLWGSGFHLPWFVLLFMLFPVITRLVRMFNNKD